MLAIINGNKEFRDNFNQLFEVKEKGDDQSVIKSVFDDTELVIENDKLAFEKNNKIIIFEGNKTRHPEDFYIKVRLVYLTKKGEFATRIYNTYTKASGSSNYFLISDKNNQKGYGKKFNSAFVNYINR